MQLPEGVETVKMSAETVKLLWDKFNLFPKSFPDYLRGDQEAFVRGLLAPDTLFFALDDAGVIYLTEIIPGFSAKFNVMFWDQKLRGKEGKCSELLDWAFQYLNLHRVWTAFPAFAKAHRKFVDRLGFLREGYLRDAYPCLGVLYDVYVYAMLKGDRDGIPRVWE